MSSTRAATMYIYTPIFDVSTRLFNSGPSHLLLLILTVNVSKCFD